MSRARRDIGKFLVNVSPGTAILNSQEFTTIMPAATQPGTVTGLRWDLSFTATGVGICEYVWAIVKLKSGVSTPTLSLTDGANIASDLQSVIAFGCGVARAAGEIPEEHGNTKSMRKMYNGDKLLLIVKGVGTASMAPRGTVQFFYRT